MAEQKKDEAPKMEPVADVDAARKGRTDEEALDETTPGGIYEVDGRKVNAHGQEVTATGKVKDKDE
jgi:hypothetical protein